jgi:hypothetical protein
MNRLLHVCMHGCVISVSCLNGYHCVILPCFLPIPKEKWLNSIKLIKDILNKFKVGNYQFVDSDTRW